jgi:hypothetical protein
MAKTLEDVAKSREARDNVRKLLGCIPESILVHDKRDQAIDLLVEEQERDYSSTFHQPKETAAAFGEVKDAERQKHLYFLSGAGARWGALSRFPQNVGRILLKLLLAKKDEKTGKFKMPEPPPTVVDPFAGHNSRMELCYRSGCNYIGCDISKAFMKANFELRKRLLQSNTLSLFPEMNTATIELHECDSRKMPIKNNAGDFTITSPPYWCLEDYGDEMGQLGKNDYHEFLRQLGVVICENFRCLRSGSFAVWCVNDFRYEGKFYAYHMHTAQLMRDAGFKQHDVAIIDLGGSFGQAFASQIIENKILPKRHEYALIFVKP